MTHLALSGAALVRLTLCFPWGRNFNGAVTALRSSAPEAQPKALAAGIELVMVRKIF